MTETWEDIITEIIHPVVILDTRIWHKVSIFLGPDATVNWENDIVDWLEFTGHHCVISVSKIEHYVDYWFTDKEAALAFNLRFQ